MPPKMLKGDSFGSKSQEMPSMTVGQEGVGTREGGIAGSRIPSDVLLQFLARGNIVQFFRLFSKIRK